MYASIHSKAKERNPEGRGKGTFVNIPLEKTTVKVLRDAQEHIDSPSWYLEVRSSNIYSDGRAEWDPVTRDIHLQLTPGDIDVLLKELLKHNLITTAGVKTNAA